MKEEHFVYAALLLYLPIYLIYCVLTLLVWFVGKMFEKASDFCYYLVWNFGAED